MSGKISCHAIAIDENIDELNTSENSVIMFSDKHDNGRIKLKFPNGNQTVISEGRDSYFTEEMCVGSSGLGFIDEPNDCDCDNSRLFDSRFFFTNGHKLILKISDIEFEEESEKSGTVTICGLSTGFKEEEEIITVDEITEYLTKNYWYKIDSIFFSENITSVKYGFGMLSMYNKHNSTIEIIGLYIDASSENNDSLIEISINKVCDDRNNKYSIQKIEDIKINCNGIEDKLRGGERTCEMDIFSDFYVPWSFKFDDYVEYFKSDKNKINRNEGIIVNVNIQYIENHKIVLKYRY
tara:strand:+ start:5866 stop:6750 length:885 start_codon:yes stop_codon:yes gene_type:complete